MEPSEFPALARAKQRFLQRQVTASPAAAATEVSSDRRLIPNQSPETSLALREKLLLQGLYDELDEELSALSAEVDAIHAEIGRAHHDTARDLDVIAADFIADRTRGSSTSLGNDVIAPERTVDRDGQGQVHARDTAAAAACSDAKPQDEPLHREEEPRLRQREPSQRPSAPQRSHVAALALRAVHALVLQRFVRRFLFSRLYPSGRSQFTRAQQLCKRVIVSRAWRRWRSLVVHRKRSRARFTAAARRLDADRAHDVSVSIAEQVRERDGKFALAKRFHETKLLCRMLRCWVLAMAAPAPRN